MEYMRIMVKIRLFSLFFMGCRNKISEQTRRSVHSYLIYCVSFLARINSSKYVLLITPLPTFYVSYHLRIGFLETLDAREL